MNISNVQPILKSAKIADDSVIMEGNHGIGKSAVVKQYCDENDYFYTVLFLSHQEVGDLIGIPTVKDGIQYWSVPSWLERMNEEAKKGKHCVLFLDELNRAQADVLAASLQLVLERQIHEHHLPSVDGVRTQVIACTNPANGGMNYQVQSLDPALLDRFLLLEVEHDPESWLVWAKENNVNKIVRDFIRDNQTKLYFIPEKEDSVGATPRSWAKLADYIDSFEFLSENNIINIIRGKIGSELGSEFLLFYKNYKNNITTDDIEKFVKEANKTEDDIEILGEKLKDYLEDLENITKMEHANTFYKKYDKQILSEDSKTKDLVVIFSFLYSLEIETLTAFLKDQRGKDARKFFKFMSKDNNRNLARKIKSKVVS